MNNLLIKTAGFTLLILSFLSNIALCNNNENNFQKGIEYYKKNNYDSAIVFFNKIIEDDYESEEIYYNIGNCYYKKEQIGNAILFYEKALKLNPDFEDAQFNLKLIQLKVVDKINPLPQLFYKKWWNSLISTYSFDFWAKLSILFLSLIVISLIIFIKTYSYLIKILSFSWIVLFILSFVTSISASIQGFSKYNNQNYGIIISTSAYVKSAPDKKGTDLFILHEGTKVQLIDQSADWEKIKLEDGNEGWISIEHTAKI
ncbi:MAG: tetratricopeptide repeat protein [Cytophagales bacterium]|nr:MAG: tetratricopeptide repeat protein [Cytophagales bacterium]